MKVVPQSLLDNIYVEGSLRPMQNGFRFTLDNRTRPLTVEKVLPLEIDGERWPVDGVSFITDNRTTQAGDISRVNPWVAPKGEILVRVQGRVVGRGGHRFKLPVVARTLGELHITFQTEL